MPSQSDVVDWSSKTLHGVTQSERVSDLSRIKGRLGLPYCSMIRPVEEMPGGTSAFASRMQVCYSMNMLNVSASSYGWALNHAERSGDTDILPLPFEYSAIRHDWSRVVAFLSSSDVLNWDVRPNRECLCPKSAYGFRIATQLDPLDWLIYNALVYEIGADLESYRLPQREGVVFSWRFDPKPDGTMFGSQTGYSKFQKRTYELACRSNEQYVVVTDITDFYSKLNHHRIDNALSSAAGTKANHAKAIIRLLGLWRERQSFGLPIGDNASRLIAEVAIHDVDQALHGAGLVFARYVDDFRVFCKTRRDAHRALATLAEVLWKSHGLTLAEQKTKILPVELFKQRYFRTGRDAELEHLSEAFAEILEKLGLDNRYEGIEYDDLDDQQKASVDALNLEDLLDRQLHRENIDIPLTKFILRRLTQLQNVDVAEKILEYIDNIYPAFTDVVAYLDSLTDLTKSYRQEIGKSILHLMHDSLVSQLEYHRMHLLNLFACNASWGHVDEITKLLSEFSDHFTRRKLILALGTSGQRYWFRLHKTDWQQFSPWERRAFIRGASSLVGDERRHWYDSIQQRLDPLEKSIVSWSRQNPVYA